MGKSTVSIVDIQKAQLQELAARLPVRFHRIAKSKLERTPMTMDQILQWASERDEEEHTTANSIFSAPGSAVTWEEAKSMVALVSAHAIVIPAADMFVIEYEVPVDKTKRAKVVAYRAEDELTVEREFTSMDLDGDALHDAALMYLSAARTVNNPLPVEYHRAERRNTEVDLLEDAKAHEIHNALAGDGWL
jgi:hypothetical protein